MKLLQYRYPHLVDSVTIPHLQQWLNSDSKEREEINKDLDIHNGTCLQLLKQHIVEHSLSFPMQIGKDYSERKRSQMVIFLVGLFLFITSHYI